MESSSNSSPRALSYEAAVRLLEARGFGLKPDLSRIEALADLLDHPERTYPIIHVAGTNGKSSTARMIGWILGAHGINTGIYTSPHLQTVRERFLLVGLLASDSGSSERGRIESNYISPGEFSETMAYLFPFVNEVEATKGEGVSYFELTTAMAFEWMAQCSVGAGVFEAGMGGTWDATNVVRSDVAVLTRVEVDHTKFLGKTPLENAREKAGIIKESSRVVVAPQRPEVLALVDSVALERGTKVASMGRDFFLESNQAAVNGRAVTVEGISGRYQDLPVALHGDHQGQNAAVAIAACEEFLGRQLDREALVTALASVESPGRLEVVRSRPLVILDGAHNPDGARALASTFVESFGRQKTTLVIAISRDKDVRGILEHLLPMGSRAIFTASDEKPADPEAIARVAREELGASSIAVVPDLIEAVEAAIAGAAPGDAVVVTGSLYAVGAARDHLLGPSV